MAEYSEKMIDNTIGVLRNNDACVLSALEAATVVWMLEDYKRIKTDCIRLQREVLEANSRADAWWIPCSERMPDNTVHCLVCYREYDVFDGKYRDPDVMILSYIPDEKIWNIKSPVKVSHWMPLPELPPKGAE